MNLKLVIFLHWHMLGQDALMIWTGRQDFILLLMFMEQKLKVLKSSKYWHQSPFWQRFLRTREKHFVRIRENHFLQFILWTWLQMFECGKHWTQIWKVETQTSLITYCSADQFSCKNHKSYVLQYVTHIKHSQVFLQSITLELQRFSQNFLQQSRWQVVNDR